MANRNVFNVGNRRDGRTARGRARKPAPERSPMGQPAAQPMVRFCTRVLAAKPFTPNNPVA